MFRTASLILLATLAPASAFAATITYQEGGAASLISQNGVASYTTDGADMTGMTVTAAFAGGATETLVFAPTATNSGGATGSLFSIFQTDTTYSNPFQITNLSGTALESLFFDAGAGDTLFDRTYTSSGTPGSSGGRDFLESGTPLSGDIVVTYSAAVGVGSAEPVGDLFALMNVDLSGTTGGGLGASESWAFITDTDTLAVSGDLTAVPLPASGLLLGAGLVALAASRRRA